jgi:RNA recognition motif-containing protein
MPKEPNEFTKDYSTAKVHRFAVSVNAMKHLCPPSKVLHVANLPPTLTEDELASTFGEFGQVVKAKTMPSTPKASGYVEMENLDDAVTAMITLNHTALEESPSVRVSFTKLAKITI